MAHWVGVIYDTEKVVLTGDTKQEIIFKIGVKITGHPYLFPKTILPALERCRENPAIFNLYGDNDEPVEAVKVFPCSCGDVKRHTES